MPTLRQINVHPQTQERLLSGCVGVKRKHAATLASNSTANFNCNDIIHDDNHEVRPIASATTAPSTTTTSSLSFAAIRTPSALLSRDPSHLSSALGASLDNIKDVRASVAEGIIQDEFVGHGGHAARLADEVTKYCIAIDDDSAGDDAGDDVQGRHRPRPLMAGAMTALDMCAKTLLLQNTTCNSNSTSCIRTGSNAIDQLLSPDNSYSSFGDGWSVPYPFKIPDNDTNNNPAINNNNNPEENTGGGGGVPFGMVTEFSGPPSSGKTQLALSIAAHAAFENKLQVHYISGGNSRKALSRRLFSLCLELAQDQRLGNNGNSGTKQTDGDAKSAALKGLERVSVSSVPDAYSLLAALARIDKEESIAGNENNGTLLIIDSVSGCLGHHLSGDKMGAALVSQVALTLRQMARTHDGHLGTRDDVMASNAAQSFTLNLRRFAVVVTNGSVAKRSTENNDSTTNRSQKPTQNKPAMGRYWHVSDVGIWLEEDKSSKMDGRSQSMNFYDGTPVVGLSLADRKVVCATLQSHYGKSCRDGSRSTPRFRIRSGGIADV